MNHSLFKAALILLVIFLSAITSLAEEKKIEQAKMKGKIGVALKVAHFPMGDSSLDSIDANFDSTTFVGLNVSYFPLDNCSLEMTVGSLETDIHLKADANRRSSGSWSRPPSSSRQRCGTVPSSKRSHSTAVVG